MNCNGCQATFQYIINEPITTKTVSWEDQEFHVAIRSLEEITSLDFNQETRRVSFDVNNDNQFVTLIIPLELLWNPYEVLLNDEKLFKHEYFSNGTHVWLNIKPPTAGTVEVIGTSVIPEFPLLIPLFLGMTAVILLQFRNKLNLH